VVNRELKLLEEVLSYSSIVTLASGSFSVLLSKGWISKLQRNKVRHNRRHISGVSKPPINRLAANGLSSGKRDARVSHCFYGNLTPSRINVHIIVPCERLSAIAPNDPSS